MRGGASPGEAAAWHRCVWSGPVRLLMRPPGFAKVLRLRETRGQEVSGVLAKTSKGMDLSLGCLRGQHSPPETHRRRKEASSLSPGSALVLGV